MSATSIALGMLKHGDSEGLSAFLKGGDAPREVAALPEEDNVICMVWRKSGRGYVRLLGRLNAALHDGRTMYRIVNHHQDTFRLPEYDQLMDVGTLTKSGVPLLQTLAVNMTMAMEALYRTDMGEEQRRERMALVFPHVHLYGPARKVTLVRWLGGLVSLRIRTQNAGIRKFRAAHARLEETHALMDASVVFAYQGWLELLKCIADGRKLVPQEGDHPLVGAMMNLLNGADAGFANLLLVQARHVMDADEMRFNYPE
ncbi:MAG: hypothetical protein EON60_11965 [Alphaproteobacteria bacterium]|nr:MAG: hypothetical protein EON60_11965 [Alphaproteobacteria bacterium]